MKLIISLDMPSGSVQLEKQLPRKPWVVDEKKVLEDDPKILSPEEMEQAYNSQGHVNQ